MVQGVQTTATSAAGMPETPTTSTDAPGAGRGIAIALAADLLINGIGNRQDSADDHAPGDRCSLALGTSARGKTIRLERLDDQIAQSMCTPNPASRSLTDRWQIDSRASISSAEAKGHVTARGLHNETGGNVNVVATCDRQG
jgi:hypothetical protein